MKRLFLPLLGFLSLVLMCCNDNKESGTDSYDPNKPVTIDYFTWGKSETVELQKQRKRIGSMIETPALFPAMTAYQNMEIQRIQRG